MTGIFSFHHVVLIVDENTDITTVEVSSSNPDLPKDENITSSNNSHSREQLQRIPSPIAGQFTSRERTPPIGE